MNVLVALGLPLVLLVGGIAAWRISRKEGSFEAPEKPAWRDDSLDDWRRERDAQLEQERLQRLEATNERLRTGQEEEQDTQRTTHTRLGG
ncbi:MAG: hypothetical protein KC482_09330 [Dehalococcoidia bacterium]|nr:hypothetical protein [Dehalococcoidia bacterium]MCA9853787.1 hypothetical protein [Dehalococcoidia bacterium]